MIRGYKTELQPNNKQRTAFLKHAGAARYAYNWGLSVKQTSMDNKEKIPSAIDLHREINKMKKDGTISWGYNVSKCSFQESLRDLDYAFANFFRKCKLKKAGKIRGKVGFPRFKSKKTRIGSFRFTGTIKVINNCIQLPRIGVVRLKELGYLPEGKKILSATVSERAGRWFCSVQVEEEKPTFDLQKLGCVGVDLGIKTLAVCSDGTVFENPKPLRTGMERLKKAQRVLSRRTKGGKNRKKAQNRVARIHYRISNIRRDSLHKLTTYLTKTKSEIVLEDLNVSGMMRNHKLAQAISDVGFYELRRQIEYKSKLYECKLTFADRFFPSSKRCSKCGNIKEDLSLSDRIYSCECGNVMDRDLNAAINLEKLSSETFSTVSSTGTQLALSANRNAFGEGSSGDVGNYVTKLSSLN